MALHKSLTVGDIHIPYNWSYADAAARTGASGFVAADVGKFARQLDDDSLWMLTATTPTWIGVSALGPPAAHAATHKGGGGDVVDDATTSLAGLMSSSDKTKLDALVQGAISLVVRNESGGTLYKHKLVYASGYSVGEDKVLIALADKDDSDKRPALGITVEDIDDDTNGTIMMAGLLNSMDTSAWSLTDQLCLGDAGALSRPPPDEDPFTGEVQMVGSVTRVHATTGEIKVCIQGMDTVTAAQVFALVGTSGTPSGTNKYVTDADTRVSEQVLFFEPETASSFGDRRVRNVTGSGSYRFNFYVPSDFGTLQELKLLGICSSGAAASDRDIDLNSDYAALGETYNQHSESDTTTLYDFTGKTDKLVEIDLSGVFSSLAAGDHGGAFVDHKGIDGDIDYLGIMLRYTK